jgi:flagellar biosynthesis protein FlhG
MANIAHVQKKKILRSLKMLPAEYLVVDLGSGSTYNTLDFFSLGRTGIMVTTPDHPSILKMLTFLKNYIFRQIEDRIGSNGYVKSILTDMYDLPMESQIQSLVQLEEILGAEDPELANIVQKIRAEFRPRIVFNMGTKPEDMAFAKQIDGNLKSVLGVEADYFGFIFADPLIREAIQFRRPFLLHHPDSIPSQEINKIAERIQKFWNMAIPGSSDLILARATKIYQENIAPSSGQPPVSTSVS